MTTMPLAIEIRIRTGHFERALKLATESVQTAYRTRRAEHTERRLAVVQLRMARRRKKVENAWFRRLFRFVAAAVE